MSKVARGGGSVTVLATGLMGVAGLAVDGASVYCSAASNKTVVKFPIGGGGVTTLAASPSPSGIAVDATRVYWADLSASTVVTVLRGGGSVTTLASGQTPEGVGVEGIAVDATSVYWVTGDGTVKKVAKP